MSRKRTPVSDAVAAEVILRCRRRCALCFGIDENLAPQKGQIAHINHNSTHSSADNLVWLCVHHHDEYDARRFQTKGYLPSEVRKYKQQLELLMRGTVIPQQVKWGPSDGLPPGISVIGSKPDFIPWRALKPEIETRFLIQLGRHIPAECSVETRDYFGRKDWTVRIYNVSGAELGHVWFGGNPEANWSFDGLVRAGYAVDDITTKVWDTFQRYSDGTYHRYSKPV